jgi:hypothetical protein
MYIYRPQNKESADDMIEKQALLEALMMTQVWSEEYVRKNPFIYITPRSKDLEGAKGSKLLNQFKKVFFNKYNLYSKIIDQVVPQEFYLNRASVRAAMRD